MALERAQELTINLGSLVSDRLNAFYSSRMKIQTKQEADFQQRIASEGLSYSDQLSFRKSQLSTEQSKDYPDQDYISSLKTNIASITKLVRYEKIRNTYLENYTQYKEGKQSIDTLIQSTQGLISNTTDPDLKDELNNNLSTLRQDKYASDLNVIQNRITLAQNDKSTDELDNVLSDVNSRRNEAILTGDTESVSNYDLMVQSIKQQKQNLVVSQKVHDLDLQTTTNNMNSSNKLSLLNSYLSGADTSSPIVVGGVKYNSEQEYWTQQKQSYLSGTGSGQFSDFFSDLINENKSQLDVLSSNSPNSQIPYANLNALVSNLNSILGNSDLSQYADKVNTVKSSILGYAAGITSGAILDEYARTGNYNDAVSKLNSLSAITGVNQEKNITTLVTNESQVRSQAAKEAYQGYSNVPPASLTPEENIQAGSDLPAVIAGEKPIPNTTPTVQPVDTGTNTAPKTNATVVSQPVQNQPATTPAVTPAPSPTTPKTYKVVSGDTASQIAQKYGTTVAALQKANSQYTQFVNNPNYIQADWTLNLPS